MGIAAASRFRASIRTVLIFLLSSRNPAMCFCFFIYVLTANTDFFTGKNLPSAPAPVLPVDRADALPFRRYAVSGPINGHRPLLGVAPRGFLHPPSLETHISGFRPLHQTQDVVLGGK